MKLLSIVLTALATSSVQGAALQRWCMYPGQGCFLVKRAADTTQEVKRAADAMADAMAEAKSTLDRWCHFPGQGCTKAKRAIEAVDDVKRSADALAEAMAILDELEPEDLQEVKE
ncbi:mating alpha-pheromone PpgA [Aspergillus lucknowensis]|uniref:Mating alpha-pheromone PpgA n=1 Tax=Aspergillus lucknowensis TaxID=176173 RepID=A0ABR4LJ28_9EURO